LSLLFCNDLGLCHLGSCYWIGSCIQVATEQDSGILNHRVFRFFRLFDLLCLSWVPDVVWMFWWGW
jgi:hypothetical protein